MRLNVKQLLLLDGFAALGSCLSLTSVLLIFRTYFGIPTKALILFSIIALVFSIHSISSYLSKASTKRKKLKLIAYGNLFYGALLFATIIYFHHILTVFDFIYFSAEILILAFIIWIELSAVERNDQVS